jgi:hypothetical protein
MKPWSGASGRTRVNDDNERHWGASLGRLVPHHALVGGADGGAQSTLPVPRRPWKTSAASTGGPPTLTSDAADILRRTRGDRGDRGRTWVSHLKGMCYKSR